MDIDLLVKICSRAWSLSILALMSEGVSGRQAQLIAASGAGRTALVQSLKHVIELGLIERNEGHGHPLRPEFVLTHAGRKVGKAASRVLRQCEDREALEVLRRAWTLPVLAAMGQGASFGELSGALAPITGRALSQALKVLEAQGWLLREVQADTRPPRVSYRLTESGAKLVAGLSCVEE